MSTDFEEIDYRPTPLGDLVLRRRRDPRIGNVEIYEVKLGDEFLMSSLFHASEVALADLCLASLATAGHCGPWDVVVGGLGLGHTADAALRDERVATMQVIELFDGVIDWHRQALVPLGARICSDARCELVHADFFSLVADAGVGLDKKLPARRYDALLVDIDHSPDNPLDTQNLPFYEDTGLNAARAHLKPGGVFGLWSDAAPDAAFTALFATVFDRARAEVIRFDNPYTNSTSAGTVYLGHAGDQREVV
ncbi:MAG: hypothetical protein WBD13_18840 [Burkholderiaceae bacterium]